MAGALKARLPPVHDLHFNTFDLLAGKDSELAHRSKRMSRICA
jgi:hypothetical protein